ncbi:uncharacterized protein LOC132858721 isoform X4 [Tachysurus vachellii]|uniref:uncharacterized protein LOC132858721 isoform X4 n=1 Tax=Tachysurus vachellii TaxID=175792 RepID=UPI00296AA9A2|nr:uncharacterized protein LOC132858721 isoform X4 [Tachysurus vachellii]XP_060745193.1 uncharacterized protein LOC132858721 isoform X4 [Tachysurus vachellii]
MAILISSLLILVLLSVRTNTDESNLDCFPSVMVLRNTARSARVTDLLMIYCTVVSEPNCWNNIAVLWCRIDINNKCRSLTHSTHTSTEWRNITKSKRVLFLIFWEISLQDSGLYRCEIRSPAPSVSHAINVTVTDIHIDYNAVSTETITKGSPVTPVTGLKKFLEDEDTMTTVIYEEADKSSVQD